jgi:hypothetical protein
MVAQNFLFERSSCHPAGASFCDNKMNPKWVLTDQKSAETCWIHNKFTMNVLELVLFEIKETKFKKTLIMLTTLKEFVLYKARGRDPLLAYHGNNPQANTHTHTHSLSLSHHATRLSKKKVYNEVSFHMAKTTRGLIIGFWEWNFFRLYFNDVNVFFWMVNCNIMDSAFP